MSRSDSKIDLAKYAPSLEAMREVLDEQAAQERMRKALDNPALDAALVEYRGDAVTIPTGVPVARTAAGSPWGGGVAGAIDKGGLPSAHAPVTTGVGAAGAEEEKPRAWSTTNKALAAIGLAFLPAMLVFVLFVKPAPQGVMGSGAVAGSAMVTGGAGVGVMGSASPVGSALGALPVASGEVSAGAPDAGVSAVAPLPVAPPVPVGRPKESREIKNARDPAPRPLKRVEIVTPPAPIPTLAPVAHPTPTAVPSAAPPAKPEIIN